MERPLTGEPRRTRTMAVAAVRAAVCLATVVADLIGFPVSGVLASDSHDRNELVRRYNLEKPIDRWRLERNPIAARTVPAREIVESNKPVNDIPPCGFAKPVFWFSSDQTVVVDRNQFTDLRTVRGQQSKELGPEGILIGRMLETKRDPRQVVKLLVLSGVVDANIHVVATVSLMEEGRDDQGYWCRLVSDDRYWTNQENRVLYDFAIRISSGGEIRLMHVNSMGAPGRAAKETMPDAVRH